MARRPSSDSSAVWYLIGGVLALAVVIVLSPVLVLGAGIWWYVQKGPTVANAAIAGAAIVGSAIVAVLLWPQLLIHTQHTEEVPDVTGDSVTSAADQLRKAGFEELYYVDETGPAGSGYCTVVRQSAEDSADTRSPLTLWVACE